MAKRRKGRNGDRPTNKRYKSEQRWEVNKAKRVKRVTRELDKAKAGASSRSCFGEHVPCSTVQLGARSREQSADRCNGLDA